MFHRPETSRRASTSATSSCSTACGAAPDGVFGAVEAAELLGTGRGEAARLLAYLARRGFLARLCRGLYANRSFGDDRREGCSGDPFVVAERVFRPCYIGGFSVCAHWGLTDQVFGAVLVVTARPVRERHVKIGGTPYHLTVRRQTALFGTTKLERGSGVANMSDPSRTLVDVLDDPRLAGGVRTAAGVADRYLASEYRDDDLLVDYGDRLNNGALFKRLGFVLEHSGADAPGLVRACLDRRSSGLVLLDPSIKSSGRIVRRWRLRVNVSLVGL